MTRWEINDWARKIALLAHEKNGYERTPLQIIKFAVAIREQYDGLTLEDALTHLEEKVERGEKPGPLLSG